MTEKNTFEFITMYTPYGITMIINEEIVNIGDQEIKYLLQIESNAKHSVRAPKIISFKIDSISFKFTEEEWAIFIDMLQNILGSGGHLQRFID